MKKIALTNYLFMYQFNPDPGRIIGQNIYVLLSDDECIVFDAGYERHLEKVLEDIKDYNIKSFICTHFHPDHVYGLNILPKQSLIGSKEYVDTLAFFNDLDNELLIPSIVIEEDTTISFHKHKISITLNQGHSKCGMLIDIDGEYLLVGDDLIATNDGIPVLPYVAATLEIHIQGLKNIIENYKGYLYLPAHGATFSNLGEFKYRLRYLEFCKQGIPNLEQFYTEADIKYANEKWHSINLKMSKRVE